MSSKLLVKNVFSSIGNVYYCIRLPARELKYFSDSVLCLIQTLLNRIPHHWKFFLVTITGDSVNGVTTAVVVTFLQHPPQEPEGGLLLIWPVGHLDALDLTHFQVKRFFGKIFPVLELQIFSFRMLCWECGAKRAFFNRVPRFSTFFRLQHYWGVVLIVTNTCGRTKQRPRVTYVVVVVFFVDHRFYSPAWIVRNYPQEVTFWTSRGYR